MNGLFFLDGVVSDITSVSPNHDEHHGHFVGKTNKDWAKNQTHEEGEYARPAE